MKQEQVLEKVDAALSELEAALANGKSEQLVTYLKFMGQFHQYSFGNVILIWSQFPEASFVAGYRKWQQLGRQVRKGEKGIRILAPLIGKAKAKEDQPTPNEGEKAVYGYRSVPVFDVSQTDGDELPGLGGYEGEPVKQLAALETFTDSKGIKLIWDAPDGGALGVSIGGTILVDPSLETAERFATLVHEVAHELLHRTDRRKETTKSLRETEAEAVAFAVCSGVGVESDGHAADYIQLHQGDVEKLKASLDLIRNAASEILSALSVSATANEKALATG